MFKLNDLLLVLNDLRVSVDHEESTRVHLLEEHSLVIQKQLVVSDLLLDGQLELFQLLVVDLLLLLGEDLIDLGLDVLDLVLLCSDLRDEFPDVLKTLGLAFLLDLGLESSLLLLVDLLPLDTLLLQLLLEELALILALDERVLQVVHSLLVLARLMEVQETLLDLDLVSESVRIVLESLQLLLSERKVTNALAGMVVLLAHLDLKLLHLTSDVALLLLFLFLELAEALLHLAHLGLEALVLIFVLEVLTVDLLDLFVQLIDSGLIILLILFNGLDKVRYVIALPLVHSVLQLICHLRDKLVLLLDFARLILGPLDGFALSTLKLSERFSFLRVSRVAQFFLGLRHIFHIVEGDLVLGNLNVQVSELLLHERHLVSQLVLV